MHSTTLTSLAMLKVNIDHGSDYLNYLQPFVLQILVDLNPDPVTAEAICRHLRQCFGLEIPERTAQVVLKRLSRKYPLHKEYGIYRITGKLPDPQISEKKSSANRHIQSVVIGLIEYSKDTGRPLSTEDEAVTALLAFLSQFSIEFLKAYLRGTAIPAINGKHGTDIVLVSKYVVHIQGNDLARFESFLVLVQGHMLANALTCPDLQDAPKSYRDVVFYLDTPLIIRRLGFDGVPKQTAMVSLITLLLDLGATVACFAHSRRELERVLLGAAEHVDAPDGRSSIVMEARRSGRTKSDLLMLAGKVDELISETRIELHPTPKYIDKYQIDELVFGDALEDEISYYSMRAKDDDINSVRSIYALRAGTLPTTIESAKAVFVTSNSGFARAAFDFGQNYEESIEVSSVITDFSLANMAWLKAPMGAPSLPATEVLAFSYAALQPSMKLLARYMEEIEKLERTGKITPRDHQILRSSMLVQDELMHLTMGDDSALTEDTIAETLSRVTQEIKKEENARYLSEQAAHRKTQQDLADELARKEEIQQRVYWRCYRQARVASWTIAIVTAALLLIGIASSLGLKSQYPFFVWLLGVGVGLTLLATATDMIWGFSVVEMRKRLEKLILVWCLGRESTVFGMELEKSN